MKRHMGVVAGALARVRRTALMLAGTLALSVVAGWLCLPVLSSAAADALPHRLYLPLVSRIPDEPGWYLLSTGYRYTGHTIVPYPDGPSLPQIRVAGEVANYTGTVQFVQDVIVAFYDDAGNLMSYRTAGGSYVNYLYRATHYYKVEHGEKMPFWASGAVEENWASYRIFLRPMTPNGIEYTHDFAFQPYHLSTPPAGWSVYVDGLLWNQSGSTLAETVVYLTVYDAEGDVLDVGTAVDLEDPLAPGRSNWFSVAVDVPNGDYSGFVLGAEAQVWRLGEGASITASANTDFLHPSQLVPVKSTAR
ncbi:MAG: FxLYD domain-containing protein [Chloroflexota bacterium]